MNKGLHALTQKIARFLLKESGLYVTADTVLKLVNAIICKLHQSIIKLPFINLR